MIFVNLPVSNLNAAMAFYQALGFDNNRQFSDESAVCMVWSQAISVMLLTHEKWRTFTQRPIPATSSSEVLLALLCDSREAVDLMLENAAKHGGVADVNPLQEHGFMYSRSLTDLDGHVWEPFWMDPAAMSAEQP
jgi:hypothetical protein